MFSSGSLSLWRLWGIHNILLRVFIKYQEILAMSPSFRFVLTFSAALELWSVGCPRCSLVVSVSCLASFYPSLFSSSSAGWPLLPGIARPASYNSWSLQAESLCLHSTLLHSTSSFCLFPFCIPCVDIRFSISIIFLISFSSVPKISCSNFRIVKIVH